MAAAGLPPGVHFTCMSCRVGFASAEAHRRHFKSDWHRYNLKRKVAEMPPVSADEFRARLMAQRELALEAEDADPGAWKCIPCGKRFNSKNAHENHIKSKRHREKVAKAATEPSTAAVVKKPKDRDYTLQCRPVPPSKEELASLSSAILGDGGEAMDMASADEENEEYLPPADVNMTLSDCIFSGVRSKDLHANIQHMAKAHGFFIPDVDHLINLSGLITYLQIKVSRYHMCLFCNKAFHSTEAARSHMVDKGHCFINYDDEGQLEVEEFYSFGQTEQGTESSVAAVEDDGDSDWEDVDEDDAAGSDTEGGSMADIIGNGGVASNVSAASRALVEVDESDVSGIPLALVRGAKPATVQGYDLVLPSGARVGHRSLKRYYKQQFAIEDERDSVVIQTLVSEYNAIGLPGFGSGAPTKEARRERDKAQRAAMTSRMRQGMRHNKSSLTKHFREQNTQ